MSGKVDTNTVEMRFDNKNFESNAKQSMSTLEKLKQALKLDGASAGLKEVENASKKLDFKDTDSSITKLGKKFSLLEEIAVGVFRRIGEKAADAGMNMVKSLTVDQVASGWNKYAEKTTAVQTIMANLKDDAANFVDEASKMEYVERYLDRLMWFSDETSYSFTDMTGNVGKFIANGQGLEDSVTAMQGIATWAAMSGQNVQTASRAMYNISQAMGVGSMKIKDWMSIETANMATEQFKELAIMVGENQGKLKKGAVSVESFGESLSGKGTKGWFDKGVMMEVFKTYGEAADKIQAYTIKTGETATDVIREVQNGNKKLAEEIGITADSIGFRALAAAQEAKNFEEVVTATTDAVSTKWLRFFENIFGNYLEAKKLWTDLSTDLWDIFAAPLDEINSIMSIWKRGFFGDVPKTSIDIAYEMGELDKLEGPFKYVTKELAKQQVAADKDTYSIRKLDDGTEELVRTVQTASGAYITQTKKIYQADKNLLSGRDMLITGFKNLLDTFFHDTEDEKGNEILSVLGIIKRAFQEIFFPDADTDSLGKKLWTLTKNFKEFTENLKPSQEVIEKLKNAFKGFFTIFKIVGKFISAIIRPFKELFQNILGENPGEGLLDFADDLGTWIQELEKYLDENGVFNQISDWIRNGIEVVTSALDWVSNALAGMSFSDLFTSIKDSIKEFFTTFDFKEKFEKITSFFTGVSSEIDQVNGERLPEKLTPLQNFWIGLKKLFQGLKDLLSFLSVPFKNIATFIGDLFGGLAKATSGKDVDQASENIEKTEQKINPVFTILGNIFEGVKAFFEKASPAFEKISEWVKDVLAKLGESLGKFAENHDAGEIVQHILKSGILFWIIKLLVAIRDFVKGFSGLGGSIAGMFNSIAGIFRGISGLIDEHKKAKKLDNFRSIVVSILLIATSLLVLAGAFALFASIKFENAPLLAITGIFVGFIGISVLVAWAATKIAKTTDNVKAIAWMGIFMFLLSHALMKVTKAFAKFAAIKFENTSVVVIAIIFGAFIAIATGAAWAASQFLKTETSAENLMLMAIFMKNVAKALIIVAAAFWVISKAKMDQDVMITAGIIFGAFIALTTAVAWVAAKFIGDKNPEKILTLMSGFMSAVAAALVIVAAAFAIMSSADMSTEEMWAIAGVFGAFIGVVAAVGIVSGLLLEDAENLWGIVAMAALLIVTAISLKLVVEAFAEMTSKMSPEQMNQAVGVMIAFAEVVAVLAVVSTILAATGYGALGMGLLAAIILAIGVACLLAGAGVALMASSLTNLINALVSLMDAVNEYGPEFVDQIDAIFNRFLDNIINTAPKVKDAAVVVIKSMALGLIEAAPIVSEALIVLLVNILQNIRESTKQTVPIIALIIVEAIDTLANVLRESAPYFVKAIRNLFEAILEITLETIAAIIEPIPVIGEGAADAIIGWIPGLRDAFKVVEDETDSALNHVGETWNEETGKWESPTISVDVEESAAEEGEKAGKAYGTAFNSSASGSVKDHLDDILTKAGVEVPVSFDLETPDMEELTEEFSSMTSGMGTSSMFSDAMTGKMGDFSAAIEEETPKTRKASEKLAEAVEDPISALDSKKWGQDIGIGLSNGIYDKLGSIQKAANATAQVIHDILGFSEPKKGPLSNFHTYAPDMIKLWCSGVKNNLHFVRDSSTSMSDTVRNGFSTALDYVSSLIDDGMTDELTIRPIMDLSEIQNGVQILDSMLAGNNYPLYGTANATSFAARDMQDSRNINVPVASSAEQSAGVGNTYNNTFNITNNDPDVVADKVSRIIQHQTKRQQAVWAN